MYYDEIIRNNLIIYQIEYKIAIAIIKAFRLLSKCLYCLTKIKKLIILIVVD